MTFKEWLEIVKDKGLICDMYLPMVLSARSRKQYIDIALDVNGMAFLCDMIVIGHRLPYSTMHTEFDPYLNGRYIRTKSDANGGYTSSLYCSIETPSEITANTTLTGIFNCKCSVNIPKGKVCQLYVDSNSVININVTDSSKCYVDVWDGGIVRSSSQDNIIVKHRKSEHEQV